MYPCVITNSVLTSTVEFMIRDQHSFLPKSCHRHVILAHWSWPALDYYVNTSKMNECCKTTLKLACKKRSTTGVTDIASIAVRAAEVCCLGEGCDVGSAVGSVPGSTLAACAAWFPLPNPLPTTPALPCDDQE